MKNISLKKISIIGFFFISIIGTLSHFVFEWSQENKVVGAFSAVNESVWEHLKIVIIPAFIWLIIEYLITSEKKNFFVAKLISFIAIMFIITSVFYGYKGIFKSDSLILNIITFYASIAVGQYISYKIGKFDKLPYIFEILSLASIIMIILAFMVFTYIPPRLELFKDPRNNSYGIEI